MRAGSADACATARLVSAPCAASCVIAQLAAASVSVDDKGEASRATKVSIPFAVLRVVIFFLP